MCVCVFQVVCLCVYVCVSSGVCVYVYNPSHSHFCSSHFAISEMAIPFCNVDHMGWGQSYEVDTRDAIYKMLAYTADVPLVKVKTMMALGA